MHFDIDSINVLIFCTDCLMTKLDCAHYSTLHVIWWQIHYSLAAEDVSSLVCRALCKLLVFLNTRSLRNARQTRKSFKILPVAAVSNSHWKLWERQEFCNWNILVILRDEFTFDLMGRSFTVIGTSLSSWIWICLTFL